jgi:2-oxoacid:acceptor oxidoreductase delta subunit (pyruvate/2-ketoisovalerate family)
MKKGAEGVRGSQCIMERFLRMSEANTAIPLFLPCSSTSTESNKTGSWRFLRPLFDEKTSPCSAACPAGEDIARIEMLTARGLFKEAWETILRENPFPSVCGRVCPHPCEGICNRREFDEAVAVHTVERFLAETASRYDLKPKLEKLNAKKHKIAVVGAGPAGLSAAYFLVYLGYACDVFEGAPEPGGILRWGIPLYRLPLSALRNDLSHIEAQGVEIRAGQKIRQDFIREAAGRYDAVFLACGHSHTAELGIPGETLSTVIEGLSFLQRIRQGEITSLPGLSAIIGGGNTAIDVARSIIRLGGRALIVYRRRRRDMPAFAPEVQMAIEEGVELKELVAPLRIAAESGQYVLTLQEMEVSHEDSHGRASVLPEEGKIREILVDRVFKATGAQPAETWFKPSGKEGTVMTMTNAMLVYPGKGPVLVFGGDLVNETKSVAHAVLSGKQAAMALDTFFQDGMNAILPRLRTCVVGQGPALSMETYMGGPRRFRNPHIISHEELNIDHFQFQSRITQPRLLREERLVSFEEIDLKISTNLAIREADRCFNCGICNQCDNCYMFCPDIAVIREKDGELRRINYDYCKGCGLCVVECPRNAMTLREEEL